MKSKVTRKPGVVGIYTRTATKSDYGTSNNAPVIQDAFCELFVIRNQGKKLASNARVGARYMDIGFSGNSASRPQLQRMLDDAKAGRVEAIVVASADRLARNTSDAIAIMKELRSNGAQVYIADQDNRWPGGREDKYLMSLTVAAKLCLRAEHSNRIRNGLAAKKARQGLRGVRAHGTKR